MKTNFEILLETVETFKYSQGFYSRMAEALENMSELSLKGVKDYYNSLPQWNDTLDCVLALES